METNVIGTKVAVKEIPHMFTSKIETLKAVARKGLAGARQRLRALTIIMLLT